MDVYFLVQAHITSTKQKITGTDSGLLDGSRAPGNKDYHSALSAAEDRTTALASPLGEVISVEVQVTPPVFSCLESSGGAAAVVLSTQLSHLY